MDPIFYFQWAIVAIVILAAMWTIISHLDMFIRMLSVTLVIWCLTAIVGAFQSPSVTWNDMKTFGIVYGVGMLIVFCVAVFIVSKISNEKAYQEKYDDDEEPTATYIGEPVVFDGEVVDDAPTPLWRLWKLPAPKWQNPYAKVGNMGYGGTIGGDLEFAHCKKCGKTTPQKQFSEHTFVCREPGCANVNHFEH